MSGQASRTPEDEAYLRTVVPAFEDLRKMTSRPYSPGMYRWFRSENVVDLLVYRAKNTGKCYVEQ
jgi:hypothetical protein